ncbi:MAG TPA: GGDEF domain-containing protein [Sedimentibacter sp.]|nr:GGDEF domain-containing protein [Sedimentibacter sp.]HRC80416.1 GGDEF domain-containing protein [Sedimentibacter sp.]
MAVDDPKKYKISFLGEFTDKSMEAEYLEDSLNLSAKITSYIALVFGFILGLFFLQSYISNAEYFLVLDVVLVRLFFILVSILVYITTKQIKSHRHLVYIITLYQASMVFTYLFTLKQIDSLNYFSVIGLIVITLAIYLLPNKIVLSQTVTVIFSILFFLYPVHKLEGLQDREFHRIIAYQIILILYCNINHCWNEINKRKIFAANKELLDLSAKDPLTGIYNRAKLDDEISRWISFSERYGNSISLILFDIDDFKGVNDKYGHLAGDNVIKKVAETINNAVRKTDIFARWGGDEFVLLLPNTDLMQALNMAERIKLCISNTSFEPDINISCSFGVATYEKNDTKESLLRKVDDLLLQAKANGKNRMAMYQEPLFQNRKAEKAFRENQERVLKIKEIITIDREGYHENN